jgi:CPA1 family monovalent cation:H+ antiporter
LELESERFIDLLPAASIALLAVLASLALLVYGFVSFVDRVATPPPKLWKPVLVWGGLRGSLSVVLVLGLPVDLVHRSLLIALVFGVVALSLFLQGLTMPRLMRWQEIFSDVSGLMREYELERGRALATHHALNEMSHLRTEGIIDDVSQRRFSAWYESQRVVALDNARKLAGETARLERLLEAAKALTAVERESVRHAASDRDISTEVASELRRRDRRRTA